MYYLFILLMIGVLVYMAYRPERPNALTRMRHQMVADEILDVYFARFSHGGERAIADYLDRPLGDVRAALRLLQDTSLYWVENAYGYQVWYRHGRLFRRYW